MNHFNYPNPLTRIGIVFVPTVLLATLVPMGQCTTPDLHRVQEFYTVDSAGAAV